MNFIKILALTFLPRFLLLGFLASGFVLIKGLGAVLPGEPTRAICDGKVMSRDEPYQRCVYGGGIPIDPESGNTYDEQLADNKASYQQAWLFVLWGGLGVFLCGLLGIVYLVTVEVDPV